MQEEKRVKDIENEFIVKSLRKLEELEEWVVIKGNVMDRDMVNANLTVLRDMVNANLTDSGRQLGELDKLIMRVIFWQGKSDFVTFLMES
ncbi:hypothetical protein HDU77_009578 [Chytriomyces hyalinus]|nr:hypothetical protein HDU77_009578 [Chytriomyces hyalinus]